MPGELEFQRKFDNFALERFDHFVIVDDVIVSAVAVACGGGHGRVRGSIGDRGQVSDGLCGDGQGLFQLRVLLEKGPLVVSYLSALLFNLSKTRENKSLKENIHHLRADKWRKLEANPDSNTDELYNKKIFLFLLKC